jgi:nicotinamide mononucleotide (NMN) deamidase PncC
MQTVRKYLYLQDCAQDIKIPHVTAFSLSYIGGEEGSSLRSQVGTQYLGLSLQHLNFEEDISWDPRTALVVRSPIQD